MKELIDVLYECFDDLFEDMKKVVELVKKEYEENKKIFEVEYKEYVILCLKVEIVWEEVKGKFDFSLFFFYLE